MLFFRATAASVLFAALLFVGPAQAQNAPVPAPADWSAAQTVQLDMADFAFTPKALQFTANKPYQLRLTNKAGHGHSFDAPEFFAAVTAAPEDKAKVVKGEVEVEGGQTVDVKFVPTVAGAYKFHCSHFLHASFGMTGDITVIQ
jgi:uncharacterized cupredoxin-like copper-binding protein